MNMMWKAAGIGLAMVLTACGGETAANGGGSAADYEADTTRNWVEVVTKTEEGGFRMGNPDAPIKIVEFASLTCSHCADFAEQSWTPLTENYISQGLASFEIRNFIRDPLDLTAALLARCNGAEPFFPINERMFANQAQMFEAIQAADQAALQAASTPEAMQSGEAFVAYAQAAGLFDLVGGLGIPETRARQCLTDGAGLRELEALRNQALSQYDIAGTPTFLINGEVVAGVANWAGLEARLQEMAE